MYGINLCYCSFLKFLMGIQKYYINKYRIYLNFDDFFFLKEEILSLG